MRRVVIGSWIMIAVLSVATLTLYVDNKRTKECLAGYIKADAAATAPRIEAAAESGKATDKMVKRIAEAHSREDTIAALDEYLHSRALAEQKRLDNQPPPFPKGCAA
jgi:hypothetical protein